MDEPAIKGICIPRRVIHVPGVGEIIRQVFIIEDRRDRTRFPEACGNRIKHPSAGIHLLPSVLCLRVIAVLADTQHAGHAHLAGSQRDRLIDRSANLKAMLLGERPREIILGDLVGVHRDDLQIRSRAAVLAISLEHFADDHIRMRVGAVRGHDRRNRKFLLRLVRGFERIPNPQRKRRSPAAAPNQSRRFVRIEMAPWVSAFDHSDRGDGSNGSSQAIVTILSEPRRARQRPRRNRFPPSG